MMKKAPRAGILSQGGTEKVVLLHWILRERQRAQVPFMPDSLRGRYCSRAPKSETTAVRILSFSWVVK
jgi:hypothetical protein